MLRAISENAGEATTPEIRDVTGLSNSQVAYRRDKLEEYGQITVRSGEPTGSRTPPKIHSLTPSAKSHVDSGLFDLYDPPVTSDVKQLSTQVNHLRDRLDALTRAVERLDETVETVNAELNEELNARVGERGELREAPGDGTVASAMCAMQTELVELREEVTELDDRKKDKLFR